MSNRKILAAAASAVLVSMGTLRAAQASPNSQPMLSITPTFADDAAPRKPLMHLLDDAGLASTLDAWGINIGGVVEAGYTYNFQNPHTGLNAGRIFDVENEDATLDQVDLFIERPVSPSPTKFDLGGRMEWIYGSDARFIHANGLFDSNGFGNGPENQFDPVQVYLQANLPFGNGVVVTVGKVVSPLGYETINPSTNNFYSHSFMFIFSSPFTVTGVLANYQLDKNYSFMLGIVRGWDQALEDNNRVVSYTGQLAYKGDQFDFYLNLITGPEETNENSDYRTLVDAIGVYRPDDKWTFAINADYGFEPPPTGGETGIWWAAAGYGTYKVNDYLTVQARAEYFSDHDGVRGIGTQLYELTGGVSIKPFPKDEYGSGLMIRPEIRYDFANEKVFDGGANDDQCTFGIDALYSF